MFCPKCGTQIADDVMFCHKCGTKVTYKTTGDVNIGGMSDDSTELIISVAKVEGRGLEKAKFPLFVDDIPMDELSNGQEATYKIQPGEHCIQIGFKGDSSVRIWIRATRDNSPIHLNYIWGENIKNDIVCRQPQVVTKPSERGKISLNVLLCLVCGVLGVVGMLLGYFMTPSHSGSVVSAEAQLADMAVWPIVERLFIGGFVLLIVGLLLILLPAWRNKKKFQKELQKRK